MQLLTGHYISIHGGTYWRQLGWVDVLVWRKNTLYRSNKLTSVPARPRLEPSRETWRLKRPNPPPQLVYPIGLRAKTVIPQAIDVKIIWNIWLIVHVRQFY